MSERILGGNAGFLYQRVQELYDDAAAQAGASLSIYGEVSDVLDALEAYADDAEERASDLCGELRRRYGAMTADEREMA